MSRRLRKTRKQKKARRRSRRVRRQRGGGPEAIIAVFSENPLTAEQKEEIRSALDTKFTNVTLSQNNYRGVITQTSWGYESVPPARRANITYYNLNSPPAYLSNFPVHYDARLTKLEGEVDEALENIKFSLVPAQHGVTDGYTVFLVGVREGVYGRLSSATRASYLSRC